MRLPGGFALGDPLEHPARGGHLLIEFRNQPLGERHARPSIYGWGEGSDAAGLGQERGGLALVSRCPHPSKSVDYGCGQASFAPAALRMTPLARSRRE